MGDDDARCAKNAGAVFSLKYDVVWWPKHRKPVLVDRVDELITDATEWRGMTVHALEVMPDRVHLFIETEPKWAAGEFVGKIKANSSRVLRQEFPHLRTRLPTLFSRS